MDLPLCHDPAHWLLVKPYIEYKLLVWLSKHHFLKAPSIWLHPLPSVFFPIAFLTSCLLLTVFIPFKILSFPFHFFKFYSILQRPVQVSFTPWNNTSFPLDLTNLPSHWILGWPTCVQNSSLLLLLGELGNIINSYEPISTYGNVNIYTNICLLSTSQDPKKDWMCVTKIW